MSDVETVQRVLPGTEVAVNIASRLGTVAATRGEQARHRAAVAGCRACDEAGVPGDRDVPAPPTYRVHHAPFVVVWGAGGGQGGGLTRRLLWTAARSAGLIVDAAAEVGVVACRGTGKPSDRERAMCWGNCADGIWHANTDRVLLVGEDAKNLWRPDIGIDALDGVVGVMWDRYVCMVVDDPAKMMVGARGARAAKAARLNGALKLWAQVVGDGGGVQVDQVGGPRLPVLDAMARECVECHGNVDWIDRDGLDWCRMHRNERWMQVRGLDAGHGVQEAMFG